MKPASPFISIVHLPFNGSFVLSIILSKAAKSNYFLRSIEVCLFTSDDKSSRLASGKEQAIAIFHLLIKRVFKIGKTSGKVIKLKTGRLKKTVSPKKDSVIVTCYCLSPIMNRATINYFLK